MWRSRHLLAVPIVVGVLAVLASPAVASCTAAPCTAPVGLPFELPFSGDRGGVEGTGFTFVDGTTAGTGLLADRLSMAEGLLRVRTTAGIAFLRENSQDNALGVAIPADDRAVVLETSLVLPPAGSGAFEQAGLWYGTSEDDYVKLVLISRTGPQVHMLHEAGGLRRRSVYVPPFAGAPAEIALRLRIDRAGGRITGAFEVAGGPARAVARWALPAGLEEPRPGGGAVSRGGIFATHRLGPAPLEYAFDRFEVRCASEDCAAGPAPRDPDTGDDEDPIGVPEDPGEDEGEQPPPVPPQDPGDGEETPPAPSQDPGDEQPARPPATGGGPSSPPVALGATRHSASVRVRARVRRRALLRRGLRARVGCSEACRAKVALLARGKVVARGAGAAPGRIAILPTRRAARRLHGVRRLRVRVRVAFADGSAVRVWRRVRLKR